MSQSNYRTGFTLIELSIVLVIIGLMTGGILVATGMIEKARINRVINQVSQYDIMFRNFKTKYETLPGDSPHFDPPGDGDGILEGANGTAGDGQYSGEHRAVWAHLRQARILNDGVNYIDNEGAFPACPTYDGATPNFPKLDWPEGNAGILINGSLNFGPEENGYYRLADFTNSPWGNYTVQGVQDIFTPAQALAIDLKTDDGRNDMNGNVYASDGAGPRPTCGGAITADPVGDTNDCWVGAAAGGAYNLTNNETDCHLMIRYLPNER